MKKSTILGTIVGGVTMFLLGFLIYGLLMESLMPSEEENAFMRKDEEMIWWALILSNFVWGYLITWLLESSNSRGFMPGLLTGALLGFVVELGFDLGMYSMTNMFGEFSEIIFDLIATTIMFGLTGGIIGAIALKKETKSEAS